MEDFRCKCSKLIMQLTQNELIIKCRHCKRYVIIRTKGIEGVEFVNNIYPKMFTAERETTAALQKIH